MDNQHSHISASDGIINSMYGTSTIYVGSATSSVVFTNTFTFQDNNSTTIIATINPNKVTGTWNDGSTTRTFSTTRIGGDKMQN